MNEVIYTGKGIAEQIKQDFHYIEPITLDDMLKCAEHEPSNETHLVVTQWFLDAYKELTGKDFIEEHKRAHNRLMI